MALLLDVAQIVALHEAIMRGMGWAPAPLRDEGALESASTRPRMAAYYEGADLIKQAALLAIGIAQAQAFLDGNKRTGFAALKVFLEWNVVPLIIDPLSVARQLERVAEGEDRRAAEEAFETWLREAMTAS